MQSPLWKALYSQVTFFTSFHRSNPNIFIKTIKLHSLTKGGQFIARVLVLFLAVWITYALRDQLKGARLEQLEAPKALVGAGFAFGAVEVLIMVSEATCEAALYPACFVMWCLLLLLLYEEEEEDEEDENLEMFEVDQENDGHESDNQYVNDTQGPFQQQPEDRNAPKCSLV